VFKGNSAIAELLYVQGEQCNSRVVVCSRGSAIATLLCVCIVTRRIMLTHWIFRACTFLIESYGYCLWYWMPLSTIFQLYHGGHVSLIPTNGEMYKIQPYVIACHWLTECKWFSPDIPFSSTNMIDLHDITEKLLKEAFNTINNNHNFQLKMYKP
jgi:hypothetical protein